MSHKLLKVAAAKKCFPCVYTVDTTCLDECFLFHVIIGRHYVLYKLIVTQRFGVTAMLLRSMKQLLKNFLILYPLSPQQHYYAANSKDPKWSFYFLNILNKFCMLIAFFFNSFILWMFYIFLCKCNFLNSKAPWTHTFY